MKKKFDYYNLLAALGAILMFADIVALLAYYLGISPRHPEIKIVLFVLLGVFVLTFIVSTIKYLLGTPNIRNKR